MAVGLVRAVESVRESLIAHLPELTDERCVYGNLDKLVAAMEVDHQNDETRYGCLLMLANSEHGPNEKFSEEIWHYYFSGILMIRLKTVEDIEAEMLAITDALRTTFATRPRGEAQDLSLVRVVGIDRAITSSIVDTPHYFLPFMIRVFDK